MHEEAELETKKTTLRIFLQNPDWCSCYKYTSARTH